MLVIGLTGGIGSGKTTVANLFSELDIEIIDTDLIARKVVEPGQSTLAKITDYFGKHILNIDGSLDRKKLAEITFSNESERKILESILHPEIKKNMLAQIKEVKSPYCITVIPLLLEAKQEELVDRILVVDCEQKDQISRVQSRDKRTEKQILSIINSQIPRDARLKAADDIIKNSGNMHNLRALIAELHKKYMELSA